MSDFIDAINASVTTPILSDRDVAPTNNIMGGGVTIQLQESVGELCKKFTDSVIKTVADNLAKRNQGNVNVIWKQIYYGKIAEYGVAAFIARNGYKVSSPDIGIYSAAKKSWRPDLYLLEEPKTPIHVKSMFRESMERFGLSWTLQYSGQGQGHVDSEILQADPKQALALAYVDNLSVTVVGIVSCGVLNKGLPLRNPQSSKLVGIKKVVYNDDLQKLEERFKFFKEVKHEQ